MDWFIPTGAWVEQSEIGLARNFIATHLLGPLLFQSIVLSIYLADPQPGAACYVMIGCTAMFWLLPFGLKFTSDLRLMALISVELLCITALAGTTYYGGVNSPFLPWLLVSLMLGLFYLSDHVRRVVLLFTFNIVVTIVAHLLHTFPQHVSPENLSAISWFSMFAATSYMSVMAIYYAGIVSMSSDLERETERHRDLAQRMREAKLLTDAASLGKTVLLTRVRREFEQPLIHVIALCQKLLGKEARSQVVRGAEVERIRLAGQTLLRLVQETVDVSRTDVSGRHGARDVLLDDLLDQIAAATQPLVAAHGFALAVEKSGGTGIIRIETARLKEAFVTLLAQAATVFPRGKVQLSVRPSSAVATDWVEFSLRLPSPRHQTASGLALGGHHPTPAFARIEQVVASSQMRFAALGGKIFSSKEDEGTSCFVVELPARPIAEEPAG